MLKTISDTGDGQAAAFQLLGVGSLAASMVLPGGSAGAQGKYDIYANGQMHVDATITFSGQIYSATEAITF